VNTVEVTNAYQVIVIITPWILTFLSWVIGGYFAYRLKLAQTAIQLEARDVRAKVENIHIAVNSRMDELLDAARKLARAEGVLEGAAQQKPPGASQPGGAEANDINMDRPPGR